MIADVVILLLIEGAILLLAIDLLSIILMISSEVSNQNLRKLIETMGGLLIVSLVAVLFYSVFILIRVALQ